MINFTVDIIPMKYKPNNYGITTSQKFYVIYRTDTGKDLGVCRKRYTPIQNSVMFDIMDNYKVQDVQEGIFDSKSWLNATLVNHNWTLSADDSFETHLLLINSHDGSTSLQAGLIPFRLKCANQFAQVGIHMMRYRHTPKNKHISQAICNKIDYALNLMTAYKEKIKAIYLYDKQIDLSKYFWEVFQWKKSKQSENKIEKLVDNCHSYLLYNAFNTVTFYLTHESGNSAKTRLKSLWLGRNAKILERALSLSYEKTQKN